ncbi:SDR family oxidoreductase [Deinococcus roseus]|uniref:Short-chain dehydrogenase n=1 Tax=Deinococcus roseus TaxID=392414 RepID=A0ABQ2DEU3_9DEIO|nr:SDR family oxidoreductase [Deinococcus roseus]GGJ55543.1 short-chain dehydrogenase [Deinococcus roseus]
MKIQNSVALVTGANRGIGRALVQELLASGAKRVYATARDIRTLKDLLETDGDRVKAVQLDITDRHQVAQVACNLRDVNLLINNAGVLSGVGVLNGPVEHMVQEMDTNHLGTLNMVRHFAGVIEENGGGAVVNLLTIIALASMPGFGAYSASKAAAWSMTQSIRAELKARNIEVYGVFPGAVDTDMIKDVQMPKTSPDEVAKAILAGVEAGTEDIFPDPMSQQLYEQWRRDHKAVERLLGAM